MFPAKLASFFPLSPSLFSRWSYQLSPQRIYSDLCWAFIVMHIIKMWVVRACQPTIWGPVWGTHSEFIHSVIQDAFIESLQCARHCAWPWVTEMNRQGHCCTGVTFPVPIGSTKMIDTIQANDFLGVQPGQVFLPIVPLFKQRVHLKNYSTDK